MLCHGAEEGLDRGLQMVDLRLGVVELDQDLPDREMQVVHALMKLRDLGVLLLQLLLEPVVVLR